MICSYWSVLIDPFLESISVRRPYDVEEEIEARLKCPWHVKDAIQYTPKFDESCWSRYGEEFSVQTWRVRMSFKWKKNNRRSMRGHFNDFEFQWRQSAARNWFYNFTDSNSSVSRVLAGMSFIALQASNKRQILLAIWFNRNWAEPQSSFPPQTLPHLRSDLLESVNRWIPDHNTHQIAIRERRVSICIFSPNIYCCMKCENLIFICDKNSDPARVVGSTMAQPLI